MPVIDLTQLAAQLGDYYRQRKNEVLSKMYQEDDTRKVFHMVSGIQDQYVMTEALLTEFLQAYQPGWTPKGSVKFKPNIIQNYSIKIDWAFNPKDFEGAWIGYLKTNGSTADEFPFVHYIYMLIRQKVNEELANIIVNGEYIAPTAGTAGSAINSLNGLRFQVSKLVTDGVVTPHATGALDPATIGTQMRGLWKSVPAPYRHKRLSMITSQSHIVDYYEWKEDQTGMNQDYVPGESKLKFSNCKFQPLSGMEGSDRLIITPPENLIMVEDGVHEEEKFEFQKNRREIELICDFKRGVGFAFNDLIWTNDQA